jgi:hypothetical protein
MMELVPVPGTETTVPPSAGSVGEDEDAGHHAMAVLLDDHNNFDHNNFYGGE